MTNLTLEAKLDLIALNLSQECQRCKKVARSRESTHQRLASIRLTAGWVMRLSD